MAPHPVNIAIGVPTLPGAIPARIDPADLVDVAMSALPASSSYCQQSNRCCLTASIRQQLVHGGTALNFGPTTADNVPLQCWLGPRASA